MIALYFDS